MLNHEIRGELPSIFAFRQAPAISSTELPRRRVRAELSLWWRLLVARPSRYWSIGATLPLMTKRLQRFPQRWTSRRRTIRVCENSSALPRPGIDRRWLPRTSRPKHSVRRSLSVQHTICGVFPAENLHSTIGYVVEHCETKLVAV